MNRSLALIGAIVVAVLLGAGGYIVLTHGTAPPAQARHLSVTITGTTPSTDTLTANQGDTLTVTFTTDKDEQVHLHGYDIHFDCKAGVPLSKTFVANNAGTFEYELEATSHHLGNLVVNPR